MTYASGSFSNQNNAGQDAARAEAEAAFPRITEPTSSNLGLSQIARNLGTFGAVAATASSLLFGTSAKAQGSDPISFDDPRLMRQVIKDPVSGVISTNYYVPKELGVDGSPVLHTVSTMALELDAHGRQGVAQVDDASGGIAATGLLISH